MSRRIVPPPESTHRAATVPAVVDNRCEHAEAMGLRINSVRWGRPAAHRWRCRRRIRRLRRLRLVGHTYRIRRHPRFRSHLLVTLLLDLNTRAKIWLGS